MVAQAKVALRRAGAAWANMALGRAWRQWADALSVGWGMSACITAWKGQPFPHSTAQCNASWLGMGSVGRMGRVRTHSIHVDANQDTRLKLHATLTAQLHTPHACYDWVISPTRDDAVAHVARGSHLHLTRGRLRP